MNNLPNTNSAPYPESDVQFLARIMIITREGDHLNKDDADRLNSLATFGRTNSTVTIMPEERQSGALAPGQESLTPYR